MIIEQTNRANVNVDSFNTISVIGKGSYAKVLLVKKKDTGKLYAMKILKKESIDRKHQENHVRTERNILVKIDDCPFIVKLYYTFQTKTRLYFILEYCPGGEMFNLLQKKRRLNEQQTQFYVAQLVLAIEYLHDHNIIYRDLKPENVLFAANGYIKITDFGLSRLNVKKNNVKSICGTPEYLAPEVILKLGYGKPVDWWTLGNIVYEMMVGVPPYYTGDRQELFDRIKLTKPRFPNFMSSVARDFIENLLRKDPSKRLGTQRGALEIKEHSFFKDLNWNLLMDQKYESFFKPQVTNNFGLKNFDTEFTEIPVDSLEHKEDILNVYKTYEGFSWNNDDTSYQYIKDNNKQNHRMKMIEEDINDDRNHSL